jgi:hypothetical protein
MQRTYLLTPIPELSIALLLGCGSVEIVDWRRRRR